MSCGRPRACSARDRKGHWREGCASRHQDDLMLRITRAPVPATISPSTSTGPHDQTPRSGGGCPRQPRRAPSAAGTRGTSISCRALIHRHRYSSPASARGEGGCAGGVSAETATRGGLRGVAPRPAPSGPLCSSTASSNVLDMLRQEGARSRSSLPAGQASRLQERPSSGREEPPDHSRYRPIRQSQER